MENNVLILAAFLLYLLLMAYIGFYYYRKNKEMSDFILGGRRLGPWLTSLSAQAAGLSGWVFMGLPGVAYLYGAQSIWIVIGCIVGTASNWILVANRLRHYTEIAGDSLTIPEFLNNRFHDESRVLGLISSIFIIIFFLIYTSSGFVSGGKLFETVFGIDYTMSLFITAGVVIMYTFLGGFMAVCWTDFIQGMMMLFAIMAVPITAVVVLGGFDGITQTLATELPGHLNVMGIGTSHPITVVTMISSLAWAFGYFGQPHILIRFMAISDSTKLKKSTAIAVTWTTFSLFAAIALGLVGAVMLPGVLTGTDSEKIFLIMTKDLFSPFLVGLTLSAVLAAIMSTASSQLHVAASAVSRDIYKNMFRRDASEKELLRMSQLTVLIVAIIAIFLALNPASSILSIVAYAWAGFGAAFGPVIILCLLWPRITRNGALAGIIAGGMTVLIWRQFKWLGLYEIVPGFFLALIAIVIVSLLDKKPSAAIQEDFDRYEKSLQDQLQD